MTIDIDNGSGFCYGVVRAIRMAEDALQNSDGLYSLGDIVHNEQEVARLNRSGMSSINHRQLQEIHNAKVLIRAHGEPPSTYHTAALNRISLLDATCPVVLNLQQKVHKAYLRSLADNGQVVIYGKPRHAEVNGLVGQTNDTALVLASVQEIERIDFTRPVYLFAQTTMTIAGLNEVKQRIDDERKKRHCEDIPFEVNDTICRQVSNREHHLIEFAGNHDVIIFVSGSKSSNGHALYEVCKKANPRSYLIAHTGDIKPEWFHAAQTIGICGATSTPRWLMEEVAGLIGNC